MFSEESRPLLLPSIVITDPNKKIQVPEGCNIYWSSLNVTGPEITNSTWKEKLQMTNKPKKYKEILRNVSGMAEAGRLLAVMGSSGAGKTTLLNVLTSRNLGDLDVQGTVMLDGQRVSKWKLREVSAFVQQDDMFVGTMTAREHLQFMAKLRMGSSYTQMERDLRVEDVLQRMGLLPCADTVIGFDGIKGLSCGEKKRLAFASEILTCPKILFCDEPTSGLDAFMAGHVVSSLRNLAEGGMTVLITIHQPSSQVFSLFHDVCLMACGRIIYIGPAADAAPLFGRCGFPCPPYFNPADHLIRTLAVTDKDRATCLKTIAKIRDAFLKSDHGKAILEIGKADKEMERRGSSLSEAGSDKTFFSQVYAASFGAQFLANFWRAWLTVIRDPMLLKSRLIQIIITALITGTVYFNTQITSETIISLNGIMFNHIRNINFMLQFPNVPVITAEMPIVLRENANGIYRTSAYFLAKNLAELPQFLALPVIYNVIVYWMSGLYPALWPFLFSCLVVILVTNVAISISYAVATIFGDVAIAMTVLPIFVVPIMAFGGFFITFDEIPSYFSWLSALSYFKYGYEALAVNQWENIPFIPGCQNDSLVHSICPSNGFDVLDSIDFSSSSKWPDVGILIGMSLVIRLIAYFAFLLRTYFNQ